jgi:hypothetical protein
MKYILMLAIVITACEDYSEPTIEEMTEIFGICGDECETQECIDFFQDTRCISETGYVGECNEQKCWIGWDLTCEAGEPIQWPKQPE